MKVENHEELFDVTLHASRSRK